jgi:hypothetical protein
MSRTGFLATLLTATLISSGAWAETIRFHAHMDAKSEVPPKNSAGTGEAVATLDTATKVLSYTITYKGLTGPATMAHFHGPAPVGVNAGVVVAFNPVTSPITGKATLTDAQIADLETGKWYANVHTAANPGGEIRGQMVK